MKKKNLSLKLMLKNQTRNNHSFQIRTRLTGNTGGENAILFSFEPSSLFVFLSI